MTLFPRLHERRAQLAGTLSGGERQMLALGRALMGRPKLLMLDEPSLGLAPLIVREIFRIIARLGEEGVTMLLVEQNARAALETADYGYVLESGELVHQGEASDLMRDPRVMATYLGRERVVEEFRMRKSIRSSPRKRGPRAKDWIPAFAGMNGGESYEEQ